MPVKSTIFTVLAVCLALSAAEAQARRIASMPPPLAFQGLWVAEKDTEKRKALCEILSQSPAARSDTMAYLSLGEHSLYVHTPTNKTLYDGANRYNPWQKHTATELKGVLYPARRDPERGAASAPSDPLTIHWRITSGSYLVAKGFKPKHYYRCLNRADQTDTTTLPVDAQY